MKKSCLNDWLTALRSNKYKVCRGALRKGDSYCSLGVLCDISGLDAWKPDPYSNKLQYLGEVNYLPQKVREWAKISDQEYNTMSAFVMVLNDNQKFGHSEMADLLEEKYKPKNKQELPIKSHQPM